MNKVVVEDRREVPVLAEVDVAVIGGGTAGMPAAVAAARNGARTALIERWGYTGGAAVGGLVITVPKSAGIWGIEQEFYDELKTLGGVCFVEEQAWYNVSPPYCKYLGDQYLKRAGVSIFYHCWFADALRHSARIDAVIVQSKSGRGAIRAKVFVDCTGDADVAYGCGVPTIMGDQSGQTLPATMMYMLANVDAQRFLAHKQAKKRIPHKTSALEFTWVNPGECNCWGGSVHGDATDMHQLTRMEIELREQLIVESRNMQAYLPGFDKAYISIIAEQMGVRETRRIVADYTLKQQDTKAMRVFEDSIGAAWKFTIPYRCLLPRGVENLLVAGRCIGADHAAMDAVRIVPNCFTTGQAAGTAAALAVRAGVDPRRIDIATLQATLGKQGMNF